MPRIEVITRGERRRTWTLELRLLIQRLLRQQFGRRSEQINPDQVQLGLEDLEQSMAEAQAAQDAANLVSKPRQQRESGSNRNHGALLAHMPRYEVLIDVERRDCPCCGRALHPIGEVRSEQLDIVPAQLRVRLIRCPRYACRACEGTVLAAPAPERPIDNGMATEALIAHVLVSKFCDSLLLYRQSQILARQGITLDRSTLSLWVGRACWWLTPLYELLVSTVLSCPKLFADDTTLPVLDPGGDGPKRGGYGVMLSMTDPARRNASGGGLRLYRRPQRHPSGRTPKAGPNSPIVEALHVWLQDHLGRVSAVSDLAKAIRYALHHWPGLVVFLEDGRVEMDTNVVERAIWPHTLTRKNALFAGSSITEARPMKPRQWRSPPQ